MTTHTTKTTLFKRNSFGDHLREVRRRIVSRTGFFGTNRSRVLLVLALVAVLVSTTFAAFAATGGCATPTITWVGSTSTGSWHVASNWDANRVPGATDNVCIPDVANTSAITFSTGTTSVASLESAEDFTVSGGTLNLTSTTDNSQANKFTLSGGTLGGAGNVAVPAGGTFNWTGGNMLGTGRTVISGAFGLDPAATLAISGPRASFSPAGAPSKTTETRR